jgi:uncharacterized protein (DUF1697 family)
MTYIALLRGINVGGHKLIKMADLKAMFESLGFANVRTFIQSGNVLFETKENGKQLRPKIQKEIKATFGFDVAVVIRTAAEMKKIIESSPFPADSLVEGESLYVALLGGTPTPDAIETLLECRSDVDDFRLVGGEVYILLRQSSRQSLFSNSFLERKLGVPATTRNWQTMTRLAALAGEKDEG